jgi:membrane-associated HD superfamily phosphohydrolase
VPLAAIGMTIFITDMYFASQNDVYFNLPALLSFNRFMHLSASWRIMIDVFLIAVSAGIYIVPLYATMQKNSERRMQARIIAANNVINALFMVLSVIMVLGMLSCAYSLPAIFLTVGILNVVVALGIYKSGLNH